MFVFQHLIAAFLRRFPQDQNARKIHRIDVFDFDNTLFRSPVPNPALWHRSLIQRLKTPELGWYHNVQTLSEPFVYCVKKNAHLWFIPSTTKAVRQSQKNPNALTVLLTGRNRDIYYNRIIELLHTNNLRFDLVVLRETNMDTSVIESASDLNNAGADEKETSQSKVVKIPTPTTNMPTSTLEFKKLFLQCLVDSFPFCTEIHIYEDRSHHAEAFSRFLKEISQHRKLLSGFVHVVEPESRYMSWADEWKLVKDMTQSYISKKHSDFGFHNIPVWGYLSIDITDADWNRIFPNHFGINVSGIESIKTASVPIRSTDKEDWDLICRYNISDQPKKDHREDVAVSNFNGLPAPSIISCTGDLVGWTLEKQAESQAHLSLHFRPSCFSQLLLQVPLQLCIPVLPSDVASLHPIDHRMPNIISFPAKLRYKAFYGRYEFLSHRNIESGCRFNNVRLDSIIVSILKQKFGEAIDQRYLAFVITSVKEIVMRTLTKKGLHIPLRWEEVDKVVDIVETTITENEAFHVKNTM